MAASQIVLKFGSSVLRTRSDLPATVSEILRWRRGGKQVLAVVSALEGETEALIADADAFDGARSSANRARLIAVGEHRSAALLGLACERVGLTATVLEPAEIALLGKGPREDAEPFYVEHDRLIAELAANDVVIVPGFSGLDSQDQPVLLGRGGSDLTGIYLGAALGVDEVRLIKDVDGVYERDPAETPARTTTTPRRYAHVSWADAEDASQGLIQPKAIRLARDLQRPFTVAALGRAFATEIGEATTAPVQTAPLPPLRIVLAGCGVVGRGVLDRLLASPERFDVRRVLVRDADKHRAAGVDPALLTATPEALFEVEADVLIEATNGRQPARSLYRQALSAGMSVVTANKQAVVDDLAGWLLMAEEGGVCFSYCAAVGGGAPMIEQVRLARRRGRIARLEGVLTGTANFVLDALGKGARLDEAVARAQDLGLAEADPSDDLTGRDAAAKLRILAHAAFGRVLPREHIRCAPITEELEQEGVTRRQVARIERGPAGFDAAVTLKRAAGDPLFARLHGAECALRITLEDGEAIVVRGLGAGRHPTAESVLADLGDIARRAQRRAELERTGSAPDIVHGERIQVRSVK